MEKIKKINIANKSELKKIYIHDTYFKSINIDSENKYITIDIQDYKNRKYILIFNAIIQCNLSRLSLWGGTENRILDIFLEDNYNIEEYINKQIEEEKIRQKELMPLKYDQNTDNILTIVILTNDGDRLNISCEEMIFIDLSKDDN